MKNFAGIVKSFLIVSTLFTFITFTSCMNNQNKGNNNMNDTTMRRDSMHRDTSSMNRPSRKGKGTVGNDSAMASSTMKKDKNGIYYTVDVVPVFNGGKDALD